MQPLDFRKRDGVRGVETVKRAEGNGIFHHRDAAHEEWGRRCDDKARLKSARRHFGKRSCWIAIDDDVYLKSLKGLNFDERHRFPPSWAFLIKLVC